MASGYTRIYFISNHGFVLTGLLTEADKICVAPQEAFYKAKRYIRTETRDTDLATALVEVEKNYKRVLKLFENL